MTISTLYPGFQFWFFLTRYFLDNSGNAWPDLQGLIMLVDVVDIHFFILFFFGCFFHHMGPIRSIWLVGSYNVIQFQYHDVKDGLEQVTTINFAFLLVLHDVFGPCSVFWVHEDTRRFCIACHCSWLWLTSEWAIQCCFRAYLTPAATTTHYSQNGADSTHSHHAPLVYI